MGKLKDIIVKNKGILIVEFIIFICTVIFLVAPLAYTMATSTQPSGEVNFVKFGEDFIPNLSSFGSFGKVFSSALSTGKFIKYTGVTFLIYILLAAYGIYKGRSKGEYDGKEHGSSDWSQNGEQYTVLSKNKGIVLAEKNYLPVDKRGNVNVLVVRRFWCW